MFRQAISPPSRMRRCWPALLLSLAGAATALPAAATQITAGPALSALPAGLVDPLASLVLGGSQFLVPVQAQGASALESWSFSLSYDAAVAAPADAGGLFQSVYQADFGAGNVSQISSSGLLLGGLLSDVSGWFAPAVSGDGVLAYVLFDYVAGHEGQDPGVSVGPSIDLPEPSTLALTLAAAGVALWAGISRPAASSFHALERTSA